MGALLQVCTAPGVLKGVGLPDSGSNTFILGRTQPTESNSGVPLLSELTPYASDITTPRVVYFDTPGEIVAFKDFGNIRPVVRTYNVVFLCCRLVVTDSGTSMNQAIVTCDSSLVSGLQFIQCTLGNLSQKGYNLDAAIRGHDFDAYRCLITGTMDGIRPNFGPNWKIRGCFIGFLGWWASATKGTVQPNDFQTHCDCIQTTYGGGQIIGNTLLAYPSTVVGTGTPGSGSDTGNTGAEYTQAQAVARRAELMGSTWTVASKSYGGVSREVGGVITPIMCNVATGPTAMDLLVTLNWLGGGVVHVNANADNLTSVGVLTGNRHYNDAKSKVAGKSIGYLVHAGVTATIPTTGDDVNIYLDGSGTVVRV